VTPTSRPAEAPLNASGPAGVSAALEARLARLERTVARLERELSASRAEAALGLGKDEPAAEALRDLLGAGRRPFQRAPLRGGGDGLDELLEALDQAD
jgi:hypothetical protein